MIVLRWLGFGAAIGVLSGAASALFLALLDGATALRTTNEWLVYALPAGGFAIGWVYERLGRSVAAGNDLVLETINAPGAPIPTRMAPMVLLGTVATHLFGGSAGREGTAVQLGASLADTLATRLSIEPGLRRQLIIAGVAGGFGSVFGTPLAGTIFGLEVAAPGRLEWRALVPALVAAFVGDFTTHHLGIAHTPYPTIAPGSLEPLLVGKLALLALGIAATAVTFIALSHGIRRLTTRVLPRRPWRLFVGGLAIVALWKVVGSSDFLGLGVPMIVRAFSEPALPWSVFAFKLVFTAITVGTGFIGGEVTPLFFIGAALGSTLSVLLGLPVGLSVAVSMAAMFGCAANTPLALTVMAVELFGLGVAPHAAIVCLLATVLTGQRGLYGAQRFGRTKWGRRLPVPTRLSEL